MAEDDFNVIFEDGTGVTQKSTVHKTKLNTVVKTIGIASIVLTSTFLIGLNQGWFDFGDESGIFSVISSLERFEIQKAYKEGEPIKFSAIVYQVEKGEITRDSVGDHIFQDELNFTWYIKRDGWNEYCEIYSERGAEEFTTSALSSGTYTVKVEVEE